MLEGHGFIPVSFAGPLKSMARVLLQDGFGYSRQDVVLHLANKEWQLPGIGCSMRYLLQTLGTEWGRNLINQSLWLDSARNRLGRLYYADVVVDDVRFGNEAAMIREAGGLIIHLRRPGGSAVQHVSEFPVSVHDGDVVIVNDGNLADLFAKVNRAIERFTSGSDALLELCLTPCIRYEADL
jgi:hypothetical protein